VIEDDEIGEFAGLKGAQIFLAMEGSGAAQSGHLNHFQSGHDVAVFAVELVEFGDVTELSDEIEGVTAHRAVGAEAEVMKLAGPETVVTELAGRTLLPGFVDGHSHFFSVVSVQTSALCASPPAGPCTSVADVIEPRPWN
jgi:adenine deaminase